LTGFKDIFTYSIGMRAAIGFDWRFRRQSGNCRKQNCWRRPRSAALALWHYAGRERH
jgi:hypothetical protein